MNLHDKLKDYLETSGYSASIKSRYYAEASTFLKYLNNKPEGDITLEDARDFLKYIKNEKKLSIGTINNYRSALKYLFEVVMDVGWNDRKIPFLKYYSPLPSVLDTSELDRLFEAASSNIMYYTILNTIYASGLRVSEAVSLRVRDIDSSRMQIYITESKSGSARYAILSEKNLSQLRDYVVKFRRMFNYPFHKDSYLFPSITNYRNRFYHITRASVHRVIKQYCDIAGIKKKVSPHTLRHSFSTHLLEAGVGIYVIKELLGHKSITSTAIYLHLQDVTKLGVKSPLDREVPNDNN